MRASAQRTFAAPSESLGERLTRWRRRHRQAVEGWIILTPILLYYSIFFIFPVAANLIVSFTNWSGVYQSPRWAGLANYRMYLNHPYPLILFNTTLFALVILVGQTTLAFFIALLLNEKVVGRGLYRSLFYIPTLTSAAITAQVFFAFISPYDGIFNAILKAIGQPIVIWTISAFWMRLFIILYSIWRGIGGPIVLFLAALQGIHREIYEAAMVDGATRWALIRYITLPLLRPMIIFVVVTSMIGSFQMFESVLLISGGGPSNQTNVMLLQIYNDAFVNTRLGLAAAGSMITALVLLGFTITNMRLMSRGQTQLQ
ncbi:MAG TPA: sugar ABC transporter permease [Caldilineaceae bacterium]|nr:sugar ABC transporter permease [Caldilineaceae bacterium]